MKTPAAILLLSLTLLVALALPTHAEDWLVKGRTYHNVQVLHVNPDTVSVQYDGGTGRLALVDLAPGIASRFAADAKKAHVFAVIEARAATDPIDHLIVSLGEDGMWMNGVEVSLHQGATATPAQLVRALGDANRAYNYLKTAAILETRQVQIAPMPTPYLAVRVRTTEGDKIILFQYADVGIAGGYWWNKIFASGY